MSGIKIPLVVDKASGTKQINDWLAAVAPDAKVPVGFDTDKAKQQIGELGDEFKDLIKQADSFSGQENLGDLKVAAEKSEEALKGMRQEIAQIEQALKDTDLSALNPAQVEALENKLVSLKGTFKETFDQAKTSAGQYSSALEKAEKSKFFKQENLEKWKGAFGDLKDIWSASAGEVLGLTEETVKMGTAMGDMAEKGFAVGAAFGPWGAVIGAALGAAVGFFAESKRQAEAVKKETAELSKKVTEVASRFGDLSKTDLQELVSVVRELNVEFEKSKNRPDEIKAKIDNLAGQGFDQVLTNYATLIKRGQEAGAANLALISPTILSMKAATEEYNKQQGIIDDLVVRIQAQQANATKNAKLLRGDAEATLSHIKLEDQVQKGFNEELEKAVQLQKDAGAAIAYRMAEEKAAKAKASTEAKKEKGPEVDQATLDFISLQQAYVKQAADEKAKLAEEEAERAQALAEQEIEQAAITYEAKMQFAYDEHDERVRLGRERAALEAKQAAEAQQQYREAVSFFQEQINSVLMPVIEGATGKLYENIESGKKAFEGFGSAVKKGISDSLKALGKQFAVKAISEGAEGLASLALGPVGAASAASHFAASAGFAAAALAAGVAGAAVARAANKGQETTTQSASPDTGSSSGGGFSGGPGNQTRQAFETDIKAPLVINVYGLPFGVATQRELAAIGGRINAADAAYNNQGGSFST